MGRAQTRQELIHAGCEIIARQGFNHTGINAVLSAAGVPKGSFYYYFASKEDFGLAVIDDFAADNRARLERLLGDDETPPLERIRDYFAAGFAELEASDCCRGCPLGTLGQELAAQNEVFRARLSEVFEHWRRCLADCLDQARRSGDIAGDSDVEALADFLLSGWEGAMLRAKVTRSVEPLRAFADTFFAQVLGRSAPVRGPTAP